MKAPTAEHLLLQQIKKHLDYGEQFGEVRAASTRFHQELATIPFLDEIYTTNWDDYFETECSATPYVTADDFAFWDLPGRKVFKLHGSIRNIGSLIITSADYARCYKSLRDGLIGSTLKLALATKTIVFVGYSLRDTDFVRLWKLVHNELGDIIPTAYWVTLDPTSISGRIPKGLNVIQTDATFFLREIKRCLIEREVMIPDENWGNLLVLREVIRCEHALLHKHYQLDRHPEMLFSAFYQDGVEHACGAIIHGAVGGKASHHCYIRQLLETYTQLQEERRRHRNYGDVAYIEGYMNGILYPALTKSNPEIFPKYYLFGTEGAITSFAQYRKLQRKAGELHKSAYKWARKAAALYAVAKGSIAIHHRPFL
jgi:hypothetical protein